MQKDRVANYGQVMISGSSGGQAILANHKKKSYRARGCRGGASRKGRKNHSSHPENEENDPRRLNANTEKMLCNNCTHEVGPQNRNVVNASNNRDTDKHASGNRSDESKSNSHVQSQKKMRTLPILPNSSGLTLSQGFSEHRLKTCSDIELLDQSLYCTNTGRHPTTILADINCNISRCSMTKSGHSAIARPDSTPSDSYDRKIGVGFSFFCISPSSFLSGRRKAKYRLN
jgi:hypothetical protein